MPRNNFETLYLQSQSNFYRLNRLYDQLVKESAKLYNEFEHLQKINTELHSLSRENGLKMYKIKKIIDEK